MTRKLLPYEHDLITTLDISEEEYLDFLAVQFDYSRTPEQKLAVPQAAFAVVAVVLTVVGIVFQVAAALLARPDSKAKTAPNRREQRFSPRFNFNSSQELAQYGEPLNLVYCNKSQNSKGSVRVATSLLWSSVAGEGSSQFMQLLIAVGASNVQKINFERVAFGQLPLGQFSASNVWLYYNKNGPAQFKDKELGDRNDPTREGASNDEPVCKILDGNSRTEGFSQTFTPSSLTNIGVYDPIPINVKVEERKANGDVVDANIGIKIRGENWQTGDNFRYDEGDTLTVVFAEIIKDKDKIAQEAAKGLRYQAVESLDRASLYLLGTALFKLVSVSPDSADLDDGDVEARFKCVEPGRRPKTDYEDNEAPGYNAVDSDPTVDNNFYTKCLLKAESASYQTVTPCDFVKFAIRCKLFRRIQGRAKKYGEKNAPDGYRLADNGLQGRVAFFNMFYRETGTANYIRVPIIFAARRGSDQDHFIGINFRGAKTAKWEFKFVPIGDIGAELAINDQTEFAFIENSGDSKRYVLEDGGRIKWRGKLRGLNGALKERDPEYTNEWDLFSVRSDTQTQFSFDNGPEFKITSVTEQQRGSLTGKYQDMSTMALSVFSGKGVQDLRSITAYVEEGKNSYVVNESTGAFSLSSSSTSYAPDIFADTILDKLNGIGKYAKPDGVDWERLALAKRFCKNNGLGVQFFMDGVIADLTSWRQFWVEVAPFSLLEFARIGGKETLIPAIPVTSAGRATREISISALFTAGNILEDSYKEEFIDYGDATQDLIATVIYRETESQDVFPRNSSVLVSLKDTNEDDAIRTTFDASQFITEKCQAILFGRLLCNQRRWIRRGIEFKTFPTDSPVSPGSYIYVDIGLVSWDTITSGLIMEGGALNAPLTPQIANGTYSVLVYKNGEVVRSFDNITVTNGVASQLASSNGYLFVLGAKADRKRVFRVTEVQMDEEGEVTVKAVEHPCDNDNGTLLSKIADFSDALFKGDEFACGGGGSPAPAPSIDIVFDQQVSVKVDYTVTFASDAIIFCSSSPTPSITSSSGSASTFFSNVDVIRPVGFLTTPGGGSGSLPIGYKGSISKYYQDCLNPSYWIEGNVGIIGYREGAVVDTKFLGGGDSFSDIFISGLTLEVRLIIDSITLTADAPGIGVNGDDVTARFLSGFAYLEQVYRNGALAEENYVTS